MYSVFERVLRYAAVGWELYVAWFAVYAINTNVRMTANRAA